MHNESNFSGLPVFDEAAPGSLGECSGSRSLGCSGGGALLPHFLSVRTGHTLPVLEDQQLATAYIHSVINNTCFFPYISTYFLQNFILHQHFNKDIDMARVGFHSSFNLLNKIYSLFLFGVGQC